MTETVIARIDLKARCQPAQPVFTDRLGLPIGNVAMDLPYDPTGPEDSAPEVATKLEDLPGVHLLDVDRPDKIPVLGSMDQDFTDHDDVDACSRSPSPQSDDDRRLSSSPSNRSYAFGSSVDNYTIFAG